MARSNNKSKNRNPNDVFKDATQAEVAIKKFAQSVAGPYEIEHGPMANTTEELKKARELLERFRSETDVEAQKTWVTPLRFTWEIVMELLDAQELVTKSECEEKYKNDIDIGFDAGFSAGARALTGENIPAYDPRAREYAKSQFLKSLTKNNGE